MATKPLHLILDQFRIKQDSEYAFGRKRKTMHTTTGEYIYDHTILFARTVCQTLTDMTSVTCTIDENSCHDEPFSYANGMIVYIHFGGTIQGDYILALQEKVALKLIGAYCENISSHESKKMRDDSSDVLNEVLNIAVGQSVVELEKQYGILSYNSAIVAFGDIVFPKVACNSVSIFGSAGEIICAFALNMVDLKIAKKLKKTRQDLEIKTKQAHLDGLSQLYNRVFFDEAFPQFVELHKNDNSPLSLIMIDIDFFKRFNDQYGHQVGDLVLITVSNVVKRNIRKEDVPVRFGGDELIILLPHTTLNEALEIAEKIRKQLAEEKIRHQINNNEKMLGVTLSIGITGMHPEDSQDDFFNRADGALYRAKNRGRNRIEVHCREA
jgi:diguanylate cyclase (GGDEF)-like protein